jgi:glutamate dehydrogenase (NADP+)
MRNNFISQGARKATAQFMRGLKKRNPGEREFHQAVYEVVESVMPVVLDHKRYVEEEILERMTEPDRVVIFRVTWEDDQGVFRANRAWRVQFNNAIGPYKGGLRFHPTVTLSILKFLGFEQTFKNSLTGLPMGGAKGGSNFNPKGKSDREVMRFCHSMMTELHRYIGEDTDVPAGDIGVGAREIGYLFGQYKRLENRVAGILTGKGLSFGGSHVRKEATGYGCVYFCEHMFKEKGEELKGKSAAISGSGNVALYAAQKLIEKQAKVLTMSDSSGFVYDKDGLDEEKLNFIIELKEKRRGRIKEFADNYAGVEYHEGKRPWCVPCSIAMPCATENEISREDAEMLIKNGVQSVCEGANMPTEVMAAEAFVEAGILFAPSKAANAGGVAVSGLEQSQNALRLSWSAEEVDQKLQIIMQNIHAQCVKYGQEGDRTNYFKGANIGGFMRVAEAMTAYGAV